MKRILLFIFLILIVSVNAQFNKQSKDLTQEQYHEFASEILASTGKSFIFSKEEKKENYIKYYYTNQDDKTEELIISTYTLLLDVTNTSKGWTSWSVSKISGKILTLFPIWQKYVKSDQSFDYVLNNEVTKSPDNIGVRIMNMKPNSGDSWMINL